MQSQLFGRMPDGTAVQAFTLGRAGGLSATVTQYGARLTALEVPVAAGTRNIVLGHTDFASYLADHAHLGAVAGRYANRIRGARFVLDGREVRLPANAGANTLHGGPHGFGTLVWEAASDGEDVVLTLTSPDGDQGFPGRLEVSVRYAIADDTLSIDYMARTDAPTVINLTNHAYFNLAGAGTVLDHELTIAADAFLPVDATLIPTGERRAVADTPFDFRTPMAIGARIDADDAQLRLGGGYDHCFILAGAPRAAPALAARVAAGGITLEVLTTEPAVQLYTGNGLNGAPFARRTGLCLETQHFPDSPNHPDFPSTVLRPGETFRSRTALRCVGIGTG